MLDWIWRVLTAIGLPGLLEKLLAKRVNQVLRSSRLPVGVPSPPERLVARPTEYAKLLQLLVAGRSREGPRTAAIIGMGGAGKSVLASMIARDPTVRRKYRDGVYWVSAGQRPNIAALQSTLARPWGSETRIGHAARP